MSRIYCVAGGTGGHVFPARAVAQALSRSGHRVTLIVDKRARRFVGDQSHRCVLASGVVGKSLFGKLRGLALIACGYVQAWQWILRDRPDLVISFGSYASLPVVFAAQHARKKTLVHEQNAVMGRVNRLLSQSAERVLLSYEDTRSLPEGIDAIVCGNPTPIAEEAPSLHLSTTGRDIMLLVMGGSQGAKVFDKVLPQALGLLPEAARKRLMLVQQLSEADAEAMIAHYNDLGISADCRKFIPNASALMHKADLIVARSGGGTCAEIRQAKLPSILIPLPTASDNHQYYNAEGLAKVGGAVILPQEEGKLEILAQQIEEILFSDTPKVAQMRQSLTLHALPDPLPVVLEVIEQILRGKDGKTA